MDDDSKTIAYHFRFTDGFEWSHTVTIHPHAPDSVVTDFPLPDWTRLEFKQCEGCEWRQDDRCPVAVRLMRPAEMLGQIRSYENVEVTVETPERTYCKKTDLQQGFSALMGLIMATSGCPSMEAFRPLAWFHLPFATYEETLFRIVANTLVRNHFIEIQPTGDVLARLSRTYDQVAVINRGIVERLRKGAVTKSDSACNAVVILDTYAQMVPLSLKDKLEELQQLFAPT